MKKAGSGLIYCDYCGLGFEPASTGNTVEPLACEECAEELKKLETRETEAIKYFIQLLLNGVTLKNAYEYIMRFKGFPEGLFAYAPGMKPVLSGRQDGKKAVKLRYAPPNQGF